MKKHGQFRERAGLLDAQVCYLMVSDAGIDPRGVKGLKGFLSRNEIGF